MATITLDVPADLAERLLRTDRDLPQILQWGLREYDSLGQPGFAGGAEVLEFLASLPAPREVVALEPSAALQARVAELIEKGHAGTLTDAEAREWEQYEMLEHLVRLAKTRALQRLRRSA